MLSDQEKFLSETAQELATFRTLYNKKKKFENLRRAEVISLMKEFCERYWKVVIENRMIRRY